ncbi:UPF0481 protein At3g47200-like [Arachis stenosperma]|uniref:UPF0481 protein At3g47200-like n=1 Tax=Arachis stenosperma TaxID=217475 RepID=UPI0025AC895A|nr:UPF0481 protein At3g47200-like [Arachis stenosperma]
MARDNLEEANAVRLAELVNQRFEDNQNSTPKIQRVPIFLRQNPHFYRYCKPKMISFGPIHHRKENLKQQGQLLKLQWTSLYIEKYSKLPTCNGNKQTAANYLFGIVQNNIEEIKELFSKDVLEGYCNNELTWMLFEDACTYLFCLENFDIEHPEALNLKVDQWMHIWRDMTLLENQLPMKLLKLLSTQKGSAHKNCTVMIRLAYTAESVHHLLGFVRSYFVGETEMETEKIGSDLMAHLPLLPHPWQTYKNVRDLKKSGIRVAKAKSPEWKWNNLSFTSRWFSGKLRLPVYVYNDVTPYFFRNLIAYEMCPDFCSSFECCSFFSFMDSLIDDAEDVKELRSAGVIQNLLKSDQELADFLNDIGHELPTKIFNHLRSDAAPFSKKYIQVKFQIERHYSNKWRTWLAEARSTYFNSPWSLLAFLAAFTALVLTFIQTWYAVHSKDQ